MPALSEVSSEEKGMSIAFDLRSVKDRAGFWKEYYEATMLFFEAFIEGTDVIIPMGPFESEEYEGRKE